MFVHENSASLDIIQPLNIITKKTKTTIIITKMNAYGYTVMFGILNNRNQYFRNSLNSQTDLLDFM